MRLRLFHNAAIGAALLGCLPAGCGGDGGTSAGRVVRVAAAANMKAAFDEIAEEFHKQHPDVTVHATYGSSGNFYAQLLNRAPFDLFLSADVNYPRKLVEQGLADKDTEFVYAVGKLVLWVPSSSGLDPEKAGIRVLADPSVHNVAIGNPKHAPYGRAAEAALKHFGVYDSVKDRLVLGENIEQAAVFADSGAAQAGLIALSQALSRPLRDRGKYWLVPREAYPPLEQAGVILSWARDRAAADELRSYLLSRAGRELLKRRGYGLPAE